MQVRRMKLKELLDGIELVQIRMHLFVVTHEVATEIGFLKLSRLNRHNASTYRGERAKRVKSCSSTGSSDGSQRAKSSAGNAARRWFR